MLYHCEIKYKAGFRVRAHKDYLGDGIDEWAGGVVAEEYVLVGDFEFDLMLFCQHSYSIFYEADCRADITKSHHRILPWPPYVISCAYCVGEGRGGMSSE